MFMKNVGNKIKKTSATAFYVALSFCCVLGLYYMIAGVVQSSLTTSLFGIGVIVAGIFISFFISILLAGLGDAVDSLHRIADAKEAAIKVSETEKGPELPREDK